MLKLVFRLESVSSLGKRAISATLDPKVADKREMRLFEAAVRNSERFDREVLPDGKIRFTPKQAITQPTTPATGTAAARGAGDAISSGRLFQSGFGATYLDDFEKGMRTVPLPQGVSESERLTGQQFVAAMRKTPRELSDLELASVYEEAGRIGCC
jgi:hypothetical protein